MATFSRRELDGFLTSATHSRLCTGQGIEVDSAPFGAFAWQSFAGEGAGATPGIWSQRPLNRETSGAPRTEGRGRSEKT